MSGIAVVHFQRILCDCVCMYIYMPSPVCSLHMYILYMWQAHLETASYAESQNSHRNSLQMAVRLPFITQKHSTFVQKALF